jgi:hypothetical protein
VTPSATRPGTLCPAFPLRVGPFLPAHGERARPDLCFTICTCFLSQATLGINQQESQVTTIYPSEIDCVKTKGSVPRAPWETPSPHPDEMFPSHLLSPPIAQTSLGARAKVSPCRWHWLGRTYREKFTGHQQSLGTQSPWTCGVWVAPGHPWPPNYLSTHPWHPHSDGQYKRGVCSVLPHHWCMNEDMVHVSNPCFCRMVPHHPEWQSL